MRTVSEILNQPIYFAYPETGEVEEGTFKEVIQDYFRDETTSPRGVEPRLHIRQNDEGKYTIWTWGVRGNNPREYDDREYDNEEDAQTRLWEFWIGNYEKDDGSGLNDCPHFFYSEKEAKDWLNEIKENV